MEWRQSIIIPIWIRKGDRSKVFARIIAKMTRYIVEPQLSENQFVFRKNKGCSDAIFIFFR